MVKCWMQGAFLASFAAVVASFSACSDQSNSMPAGGSDFLNQTAPANSAPVGPFPRGTPDPAFALDPATQGPEITIMSPTRGALETQLSCEIQVKVEDPNGVSQVRIGGLPATNIGGSIYSATVDMQPSTMNFVTVTARDTLGNTSDAYSSICQGSFHDMDAPLQRGLAASLNNNGLTTVVGLLEEATTNFDLLPLIQDSNPVLDNFAAEINVTSIQSQPMKFEIQGEPGGAMIKVHLDDARLGVFVDSLINTDATLLADRATAEIHAVVDPAVAANPTSLQSALGLRITSIEVSFENFSVDVPNGILDFIVDLLNGVVRNFVEGALEDILGDKVSELLGPALPGFGQPVSVPLNLPLLGPSSIDVNLGTYGADGSAATGLGLVLGMKATPTTPVLQNVPNEYFVTNTQTIPSVEVNDTFAAGLSSDAANAFLQALWTAGGIRVRLDGADPDPNTPIRINAGFLNIFFPQLRGIAPDPNTPLVLEITSESAPIARFGQQGGNVSLTAGEFQIKILIDYMDGDDPLEVMTVRTGLQLATDITLENNSIRVAKLSAPVVRSDMISEPVVDLADSELENFINAILPFALDKYVPEIPAMPVPALPLGLQLDGPRLDIQQDMVLVRGNLNR